jgi:type I restriction enzyme M protein
MIWTAPSEKDPDSEALEKRLWAAADQLRANSGLTSQQYSQPVLGLIFLRFAEVRFTARRSELEKAASSTRRGSRVDEPTAYHAEGVLYLSPNARFDLFAWAAGEGSCRKGDKRCHARHRVEQCVDLRRATKR